MSENNLKETKKCNYCKSEIDAHAILCLNCKKKQGPTKVCPFCKDKILKKEKVCPNCGKNLKKRSLIVGGIVFVVVCLLLAVAMQNYNGGTSEMAEVMGVTETQAEIIKDVLKSVGVSTITKIERDDSLDDFFWNGGTDKGYRVAFSGTNVNDMHKIVIVNISEDGKVVGIKLATLGNKVLYEDGKVLDNIRNYAE